MENQQQNFNPTAGFIGYLLCQPEELRPFYQASATLTEAMLKSIMVQLGEEYIRKALGDELYHLLGEGYTAGPLPAAFERLRKSCLPVLGQLLYWQDVVQHRVNTLPDKPTLLLKDERRQLASAMESQSLLALNQLRQYARRNHKRYGLAQSSIGGKIFEFGLYLRR